MVDYNTFFDKAQLTGIIACTAEVIAVPALRYGSAVDSCVGEQRKFVKYLDVLKFFCNGRHTTHLPQSLLKHLLPLRLLRERWV